MVHFVGAGSGAPDLITVRGARLLGEADVVIYAGSLVNPALLDYCRPGCRIYNSAEMTLEQVIAAIEEAEAAGVFEDTIRISVGIENKEDLIEDFLNAIGKSRHEQ